MTLIRKRSGDQVIARDRVIGKGSTADDRGLGRRKTFTLEAQVVRIRGILVITPLLWARCGSGAGPSGPISTPTRENRACAGTPDLAADKSAAKFNGPLGMANCWGSGIFRRTEHRQ
jgi:hypothetical protein